MKMVDLSNIIIVKSIIEKYGWLSSSIVGSKGNSALFLVIQHASKKDRNYFLPLMRIAVQNNTASSYDLAMLEDRVAIDQGKKQLYGTQLGFDENTKKFYVLPIENPNAVDSLRANLGMMPLATYLSQWNFNSEN